MASGTRSDDLATEIWGTWEELLLASAVNRHGTRSWDSVAMEIQARSPFSDLLTPQSCRQRYLDLKRRFESVAEGLEEESDVAGGGGESGSPADLPWLEELRKLRMAELRREVDRYDVSITSLQLKLKNLRAERERSEAGDREPDPKENETNKNGESPEPAPDSFARDLNSVGNSSGSCKESNSTDPKEKDVNPNGGVETEPEKTPDNGAQDDMAHPTREDSYNGSSETLLSKGSETADGAALLLGESGESVAGGKESSDVQSSASLSRRRRGKRQKAISGSSSVAEAETDAVSAVAVNVKRPATAESQPLAAFLEIIQSNKYGSIFMRRLEGQENSRYRGTIRRYVDLEIVRSRLERKGAKYSSAEFFRDLLLLCNNAIVFFRKGSTESTAAVNLRQMVSKEMAAILPKSVRSPTEEASGEPLLPLPKIVPKMKLDTDLKNPLPKKSRSSGSLIACRKRSSFSKVPATSDAETAGKEEKELGSDSDHQEQEREQDEDKQITIAKPKTKERSKVSVARGLRTNKIRGGTGGSGLKQSKPAPAPKPGLITDETLELPPKVEKKDLSPASNLTPKKKNAASFLNRLKGNSSSSSVTGTLLSSLKSSVGGSIGKGTELKRGGKGEGRKEATTAPSPELIAPAKRSVGRPPKRMAPALTPSPPPPPKRMKLDAAPAKRLPAQPQKKRGRK